ncbi:MAG: hypothetical protein ACW99U_19230 [Candidatus Thorarchaeota archaeon]|jgi:hypothetical protein
MKTTTELRREIGEMNKAMTREGISIDEYKSLFIQSQALHAQLHEAQVLEHVEEAFNDEENDS